jgi:molybdopterin-guanine dinucleotide biosynthesis protein A
MGGGDKPLLVLAGRPLLSHVLDVLRPLPVALSANGDPSRFAAFGLPVLADGPFQDEGPLAGVLAGLDWAAGLGCVALLTVPGDTPLIPSDLAQVLAPAPACAASLGRAHHLVALWPLSCRPALRAFLSTPGPRDVGGFARGIGMRVVDFTAGTWDPFLNINTPDDLARIRDRVGRTGMEGLA